MSHLLRRLLLSLILLLLAGRSSVAQLGDRTWETQFTLPAHLKPPPSPALPPDEALKTFQLEPGFHIELVASEPLVQDPVAIAFDEDSRIWVVEMRGFMPDLDGTGEDAPVGRVSILSDDDGDGRADRSSIFLDNLVLPRAVSIAQGGALIATSSRLLHARDLDGDDKADRIEVIDPDYIVGGSVEHSPNGLLRCIDNWIYSAKSKHRYRFRDGRWVKQETEFRGQWGISQDDYGRLFYNYNYSQLHADISPPNYISRNPNHASEWGINLMIATNQQVFPIRMNTGVNRGYRPEILDPSGRLYAFASACAPLVYRGNQFPHEFNGNVFVCGPGANIVKRNLVSRHGLRYSSRQARAETEFLASTDERFRPVNLSPGPDGNLYVVDMYRGIIQHRLFMTTHLRNEILTRNLQKPIHLGRIYRVRHTAHSLSPPLRMSRLTSSQLVAQFSSPIGWRRDTAQRILVERQDSSAISSLLQLALHAPDPLARIHALWTLEALPPSDPSPLLGTLSDPHPEVQIAALRLLDRLAASNRELQTALLLRLPSLLNAHDPLVPFQTALSLGNLTAPGTLDLLAQLLGQYSEETAFHHAVISGLQDRELEFMKQRVAAPDWAEFHEGRALFLKQLAHSMTSGRNPDDLTQLLQLAHRQTGATRWQRDALLEGITEHASNRRFHPVPLKQMPPLIEALARASDRLDTLTNLQALFSWPGHEGRKPIGTPKKTIPFQERPPEFARGQMHYRSACAICHGVNGRGVTPLAPPLLDSEWVLGPEDRLVRIVLHGLEGPIHVQGMRYEPPRVLPNMPALGILDDTTLAAILTYIRTAWDHEASPVAPETVAALRNRHSKRQKPWHESELLSPNPKRP